MSTMSVSLSHTFCDFVIDLAFAYLLLRDGFYRRAIAMRQDSDTES